jgi:glycosyltransferase involved in cell wall biosynthesis
MRVSIIIPAFNEEASIGAVLDAVAQLRFETDPEVIVVDDGSADQTAAIARDRPGVRLIRHPTNRGRGAAIKTGIAESSGGIVCTQDADMEQLPADIPALVAPIVRGETSVVYGCRIPPGGRPAGMSALHLWANRFFAFAGSLLCQQRLHDVYTGSKCYRRDVFDLLHLQSTGFEQEMEVLAKCGRLGIRIVEVPIRYAYRSSGRSSMRFIDGIKGILTLMKYRLARAGAVS